ncbi:hypothetical protein JCM6292_3235 [Bacteroides pyogenes JCM 6292]|uniref:Uncharacterized protein n=1 Tax=Bacteroides pyogenes JCM 6292 TaxID=1235809 RepID=W4PBH7_9BACE|nr:hypothetical protein JCM6292_3235 [Bacteroides pyogenes JCM 6292]
MNVRISILTGFKNSGYAPCNPDKSLNTSGELLLKLLLSRVSASKLKTLRKLENRLFIF